MSAVVAALFVETGGCYFGIKGVDPHDVTRDARKFRGPGPVIAHPPCARWGRLWWVGGRRKGDDDGHFLFALSAVRLYGGVLEHPEGSSAWPAHGLLAPPRSGGWVPAGDMMGWTCCVEQGHYGHRARKATWLYLCFKGGIPPLELKWGRSTPAPSVNSKPQAPRPGRRASRTGICQRMSRRQRLATPPEFRDVMIALALTTLAPRATPETPGSANGTK